MQKTKLVKKHIRPHELTILQHANGYNLYKTTLSITINEYPNIRSSVSCLDNINKFFLLEKD